MSRYIPVLVDRRKKHGLTKSPEFYVWSSMKSRCSCPNSHRYENYGARGITVCDRWRNSFMNFLSDMGNRPSDRHTLERINNDGNYEPSNCKWATMQEQNLNKSSRVAITYKGTTMCIAEWARVLPLSKTAINNRLKRGWSAEQIIETPALPRSKRKSFIIKNNPLPNKKS